MSLAVVMAFEILAALALGFVIGRIGKFGVRPAHQSIFLDDAIAACSFQPAAQPCCLFC